MAAPMQAVYSFMATVAQGANRFVPAQVASWFDSSNTSVVAGGAPRPVSTEYPMPVASAAGSAGTSAATPQYTQDANSRAFYGEVALTPGTPIAAGRSLKVNCTVAGNVSVTYSDGSSGLWAVIVGIQTLPIEVTNVVAGSTTATATYANLR